MRARAKRMRPYAMSPTQASPVVRVRAGERSNSNQDRQLPLGVGYIPCDDRCLVTRFPHHGMRGSEKIAVTIAIRGTEEEKCYLRHMTLPTTLSLLREPDSSLYSRENCPGCVHARPDPGVGLL